MADLSDAGYLEQPHTSAGRIPTVRAFQFFAESLRAKRVLDDELERLRAELGEVESIAARLERSSHMLTEMTRSLGIAAAVPSEAQTLDQVELLSLADARILMIVVTGDRMVHNRVVALEERLSQDELVSIRNYINRNFSGCVLSEVRQELRRRLEQASAVYDSILRKLIVLYDKGLLDVGFDAAIHMEGTSNLVAVDFHLTGEKMRELFRALEEKKRVLEILDRFLEATGGEVSVRVGLGEAHPSMRELSLIGVAVPMPGGMRTMVAVLGPMRMNYRRVISAVFHMGQALQTLRV